MHDHEYLIVRRSHPDQVMGETTGQTVLKFETPLEAHEFLWHLDALLVMELMVQEVPAGTAARLTEQAHWTERG